MDKAISRPRCYLSLELYDVTAVLGEKGNREKNVKKCINYADHLFQSKYYKIIYYLKVKIAEKEIMSNQQEKKSCNCFQDLKEKCKLQDREIRNLFPVIGSIAEKGFTPIAVGMNERDNSALLRGL